MSFFAGKFGDGKTVFSLNAAGGGDTNLHYAPNANTIFHSDMPYVIVTDEYSAGLSPVGYDYYTCDMPPVVANLVTNSSRVIIPMLTLSYNGVEWNTILSGGSMSLGNCTSGGTQLDLGSVMATANVGAQLRNIWNFSNDTTLDTGYFSPRPGLDDVLSIGQGTGRSIDIVSASLYYAATYADTGSGIPAIPDVDEAYLYLSSGSVFNGRIPATNINGQVGWADQDVFYNNKIGAVTRTIDLGAHFQTPTGRGLGHTKFYVRRGIPALVKAWRARYEQGAGNGETLVQRYQNRFYPQSGDRIDEVWQRTSYHSNVNTVISPDASGSFLDSDYKAGLYNMIIPVRMTWYVTNVEYNESTGTYSASNPFTASNDIRLSPSDFIVKGVNLGTVPWSFLTQLSAGALYNGNGRVTMGANGSRGSARNGSSSGAIPLPLMAGGSEGFIGGDTGDDWQLHKLALYKFNRNNQWRVDTRNNAIGNAEGDVWSPSVNPLKMFVGNNSVVGVGGNLINSNAGEVHLATVNLNMNNNIRDGSVICTVQLQDNSVFTSGGYGSFVVSSPKPANPESLGLSGGSSRMRTSGGVGSVHHHMFCTLPAGRFVPVYIMRTAGYNYANTSVFPPIWRNTSNGNMGNRTLETSFIIYLRNDGNGNVSIYCGAGRNGDAAAMGNFTFILPNLRISVQRLT